MRRGKGKGGRGREGGGGREGKEGRGRKGGEGREGGEGRKGGRGRKEDGTIPPNLGWRLDGRERARKGGKNQGR